MCDTYHCVVNVFLLIKTIKKMVVALFPELGVKKKRIYLNFRRCLHITAALLVNNGVKTSLKKYSYLHPPVFCSRITKNFSYSNINWSQLFLQQESFSYFQLNYLTVFLITFLKECKKTSCVSLLQIKKFWKIQDEKATDSRFFQEFCWGFFSRQNN